MAFGIPMLAGLFGNGQQPQVPQTGTLNLGGQQKQVTLPQGIQAPKDRGMFGRFNGFNPFRFEETGVNPIYALGAALAGGAADNPMVTAQLIGQKQDAFRQQQEKQAEEAKRQKMLEQLGNMPGVTDQQRALLSMGLGTDQLAEQAFAPPPNPKDRYGVINDQVVSWDDPTKPLADYRTPEDPKAPATGMVQDENGNWVYSPEYLAGQKEIAALRGGNQGNVQSQFVTDDGRLGYLRRDGSVKVTDYRVRNPFQIADVGGVPTAIDRLTGQGTAVTTPETVGTNKATIETITANEAARQKAQQDLPKSVATIDRGIATLEKLKASPGFSSRYGLASVIPAIPGTDMADTQALINQIGGQAFLTAFESLKGGGQITEVEGQKATQAITVLTTQGISVQMAARAIDDLIEVQKKAKERMSAQASGSYAPQGADAPVLKYNPETGEFE